MFGLFRIFLGCAIFAICLFIMKKTRLAKKSVIISAVAAVAICTVSYMFPIENHFLSFSSPEKAFGYTNSERVAFVVDGQKSSLVIGEESKGKYIFSIVPKGIDEWKLGRGIDTKLEDQIVDKDCVINLYHHKGSGDYYISVVNAKEDTMIYDSSGSSFVAFDMGDVSGFNSYFANVLQFDESYWINVNGEMFSFM